WETIEAARIAAEASTGVRLRWIMDGVRQFGVEPMDRVVDWAIKLQTSDSVVGIGIGGDEKTGPAHWFERPYARARAAGLHATVHAGEIAGPDSVWDALRVLKAERIGHGLHAGADPRLIEALAARGVVVDVCPVSNRKTGAWPTDQRYPAHNYYKSGIKLSVASDDPGIFASDLLDQYAWLGAHGGFEFSELRKLALNSPQLAFDR
ncbi:MAG: adenosine deaminase family protein, partial [Terriglobales bacterium]